MNRAALFPREGCGSIRERPNLATFSVYSLGSGIRRGIGLLRENVIVRAATTPAGARLTGAKGDLVQQNSHHVADLSIGQPVLKRLDAQRELGIIPG
jgi:hypothetical protein